MRGPLLALAAIPLLLQSQASLAAEKPAAAQMPPPAPVLAWSERGSPGPWGIYLNDMDPSVRPGDDFYSYANGAWRARFKLPADRETWNTMTGLRADAERQIDNLIARSGDQQDADADSRAVFALNAAFMDTAAIEARGLTPIAPELARIRAAATLDDIADIMARGHERLPAAGLRFFARFRYMGQSGSGVGFGLGAPGAGANRIYLEAGHANALKCYQAHAQRLLALGDWPDPKGSAKAIVALETALAKGAVRIPEGRTWSLVELETQAKGFPWRRTFAAAGVPGDTATSYVFDPQAFAEVMTRTPIQTLRAWQALALFSNAAPYLPAAVADEAESFRAASCDQPVRLREAQARTLIEAELNEALVRLHQKRSLNAGRIAAQEAIASNVRTALRARIAANPWMSKQAKAEADLRLADMTIVLGRPAVWAQPEPPVLSKDDLYGNIQRLRAARWAATLREMQGGPDVEFGISRLSANAFYNPGRNEAFVSITMLTPPYVDPKADAAVNYGGFGMLLASIMVRAVDVEGAKVDHTGTLHSWWAPADQAEWARRLEPLAAQYSAFEVGPGLFIDGRRTAVENASDLAGVLVALDAYHLSLKGAEAPVLDGVSGDQRFFLAHAQAWRFKATEAGLRRQLMTDFRSPPPWRVTGVVRNIDAWYAAFEVKPGDALYLPPELRARIW